MSTDAVIPEPAMQGTTANWQRASLGKLLPIKYGKSLPARLRDSGGSHPVFGSSGIVGTHSAALTSGPTLIVGRKGNVGAIHYSMVPCWPIDTAYYVEAPTGHNLRYYEYLLESLNLARLDRSTAIPGLSRDDYNAVEVVVAPPLQQDGIVAEIEKQFSRLDEAVANLKRVKANLKRYKAAVLKAAVEGRLVPTEAELARKEGRDYETGEQLLERVIETRRKEWKGKGKYTEPAALDLTELPALPDGWLWTSVDQLAEVVRGASPRPAGDPKYFGGDIPWITVGTVTSAEGKFVRTAKETVTTLGKENSRSIEAGTLLLTNSGATLGVPKISAIGGCINDGVAALFVHNESIKLYLLYVFDSLTESLRRINQGAAQPNLNTAIIRDIKVPLPPEAELQRLLEEIDRRMSIVQGIEGQVELNRARAGRVRQSILATVFLGERGSMLIR